MLFFPRSLNSQLIMLISAILLVSGALSSWFTAKKQSDMLLVSMRGNSSVMVKNFAESSAHYLVLQDYAGLESFLLKSAGLPDITALQVCEADGTVVANIESKHGSNPTAKSDVREFMRKRGN